MENTELFYVLFSDPNKKEIGYHPDTHEKVFITKNNYFLEGYPSIGNTRKNENKIFIKTGSLITNESAPIIQPKVWLFTDYECQTKSEGAISNIELSSITNQKIQLQKINKKLFINSKNLLNRFEDKDNNNLGIYIEFEEKGDDKEPILYYKKLSLNNEDHSINEGLLTISGKISVNSLYISENIILNSTNSGLELTIRPLTDDAQITASPAVIIQPKTYSDGSSQVITPKIKLKNFDFKLESNTNTSFAFFIDKFKGTNQMKRISSGDSPISTISLVTPSVDTFLNNNGKREEIFKTTAQQNEFFVSENEISIRSEKSSHPLLYEMYYNHVNYNDNYTTISYYTDELTPLVNNTIGGLIKEGFCVEFHELDDGQPNNCFKFWKEENGSKKILHIYMNELIDDDNQVSEV